MTWKRHAGRTKINSFYSVADIMQKNDIKFTIVSGKSEPIWLEKRENITLEGRNMKLTPKENYLRTLEGEIPE